MKKMLGILLFGFLSLAPLANAQFFQRIVSGPQLILSSQQMATLPPGSSAAPVGLSVSSAIPAAYSFEAILSSGANSVTLTSTPSLSTNTASGGFLPWGQVMILESTSALSGVILQSTGTLSGSGLALRANTRTIDANHFLELIFDGGLGLWREVLYGTW